LEKLPFEAELTVIIRRTDEPKVIQMTQADLVKQLDPVQGSEILLEDSWTEGLRKVRTPYVCLVEADCTLSSTYFANNFNLLKKSQSQSVGGKGSGRGMGGGGYTKLAVLSSALGIKNFANRVYNYHLEKIAVDPGTNRTSGGESITMGSWTVQPQREKRDIYLYSIQIGFVPGAIMRMASLSDVIDKIKWDDPNLVRMSTNVCFSLWGTGRRIGLNPSTTYVTNQINCEKPPQFNFKVPDMAINIFEREYLS
jgi:hypothetical protein